MDLPAPPRPLDTDGVTAIIVGVCVWAAALIACLILRVPLTDSGRGWWLWVCVAGGLTGLFGLSLALRRRARLRAAHATVPS